MNAPAVSVILAVKDGEACVARAVTSLLQQDFSDFELILVDDGSNDGTARVLDGFADPRIVRLRLDENVGLTRALNLGLQRARGALIARLDADDRALPDRFSRQVAALARQPEVVALGGAMVVARPGGDLLKVPFAGDGAIRCQLLFNNALFHPTVMMRTQALREVGGYDPSFPLAQDYDLFARLAEKGKLANLTEPVIVYGAEAGRISTDRFHLQQELAARVRRALWRRFFPEAGEEGFGLMRGLVHGQLPVNAGELETVGVWLLRLRAWNGQNGYAPARAMDEVLLHWWRRAWSPVAPDLAAWRQWRRHPLSAGAWPEPGARRRLFWQCLKGEVKRRLGRETESPGTGPGTAPPWPGR